MPSKDTIHNRVKQAIINDGWQITNDPYVISYGERFLFIDLGARDSLNLEETESQLIGLEQDNAKIAIEIKTFRNQSPVVDIEKAIGQYTLYKLLLTQVDPERIIYLAITEQTYNEIFDEPLGRLVIEELPLNLIIIDVVQLDVKQWIPKRPIEK
ncbi:element excision factor XisH family protein [Moorena sp. SIO3H5]|uniref:element excision factor XisH family protein n=1 Tax=Moorena sp. SIO3H5 TaxID=2607834 RepID=UPI0013BD56E8|nr:element excision factor XisH family protein [Moorena sp. SIO3H5]NEO69826.1 fatty-acid synthase [Moorena sp. SIO3H5]